MKENLAESVDITIIAEKYYSETTSFGSAGLWEPYLTAGDKINSWGKVSFNHFMNLFYSSNAAKAGIQLQTAYNLL